MDRLKSQQCYARAKQLMPGGVSSPVRSFNGVGGDPVFIARGRGSRLWDVDGNEYIDYVGSWGAAILGHAHPEVVATVQEVAAQGLSFGAPIPAEAQLAETLIGAVPGLEMLRFVSSGTEACMTALRVARGFTGRDKIVKFAGHYHGHSDFLLAKAGSGMATLGIPNCAGVPQHVVADTLTLTFNDTEGLEAAFRDHPGQLAAVILEPIVGNAGFIRGDHEFLQTLRRLCTEHGTVLIMDEVMTGFRVAWGGAQKLYGVTGDLMTFAKVVGGGLPLAVFGGRRDIMARVAPLGDVYQAGTLSGNPVAVACAAKTLEILQRPTVFASIAQNTANLVTGLRQLAENHGIPFSADSEGGMFGFYFTAKPVRNFADAQSSDSVMFKSFFHGMLMSGVYLAPSAFEAGFVSLAHSPDDIRLTLEVAGEVLRKLKL